MFCFIFKIFQQAHLPIINILYTFNSSELFLLIDIGRYYSYNCIKLLNCKILWRKAVNWYPNFCSCFGSVGM